MSNPYDKHYENEAYFGNPYPELVAFFQNYPARNAVLDLGCGQGRDALFLGRIGYRVIGINHSRIGIRQLNTAAQKEKLPVSGLVTDLYTFAIADEFDMVLLDSIFHFYQKDMERETALLKRIIEEIKRGGVICNFILKGAGRERHLKKIISESGVSFEVLLDIYTNYPEYGALFHMYVIRKAP